MPPFGMKRFKRKEREAIEEALSKPPPSAFFTVCGTGKNKEYSIDIPLLVNLANRIFGFNGWSYSVSQEAVDFVDYDGERFDVGISALVKVVLRDGTFREDMGYGISKGLKCKAASFARARHAAANDALKKTLSTFGNGLRDFHGTTGSPDKITSYVSFPQPSGSKSHATLSGVKRKLAPEFENVDKMNPERNNSAVNKTPSVCHASFDLFCHNDMTPPITTCNVLKAATFQTPMSSEATKNRASRQLDDSQQRTTEGNLMVPSASQQDSDTVTPPIDAISSFENAVPSTSYTRTDPCLDYTHNGEPEADFPVEEVCVEFIGRSDSTQSSPQAALKNRDPQWLERKLQQIDLEMAYREKMRNEILKELKSSQDVSVKKEEPNI